MTPQEFLQQIQLISADGSLVIGHNAAQAYLVEHKQAIISSGLDYQDCQAALGAAHRAAKSAKPLTAIVEAIQGLPALKQLGIVPPGAIGLSKLDGTFYLQMSGLAPIRLGSYRVLMSWAAFTEAINGKELDWPIPRYSLKAWQENVLPHLDKARVESMTSGNQSELLLDDLTDYLTSVGVREWSDDLGDALVGGHRFPVLRDGRLHLFAQSLTDYLAINHQRGITAVEVREQLLALGFKAERVRFGPGRDRLRVMSSSWPLPDLETQVNGAHPVEAPK